MSVVADVDLKTMPSSIFVNDDDDDEDKTRYTGPGMGVHRCS